MKLKGKKVLVTGAGGFIGSHLAEQLVHASAKVSVFLHYNSRLDRGLLEYLPKETFKEIEIFWGDLRDPDSVRNAVKPQEVVFNLAAHIAIPYSYINPLDVIQTNVIGSTHVLGACREFGIQKVVQTSTSETYGTALTVPINEQHPVQGQSPYAASKIASDQIAESYYLSFGLPVAILRPFNTYGPRQSARAIIPTIISQALTQEKIKLGSLSPKRDFTFVLDTAEGFIKCAESEKTIGQATNIGNNSEITIGELVKTIQSILGINKEIITEDKRIRPEKSEVQRLLCDYSKAKSNMDWEPKYSLEQGLKITIDWIKKNIGKYKPEIYNI